MMMVACSASAAGGFATPEKLSCPDTRTPRLSRSAGTVTAPSATVTTALAKRVGIGAEGGAVSDAYEQVEVSSVPFLRFVANKGPKNEAANYSFVLRGYVRHWLANVWSEYDRIKLTDIVASKEKSGSRASSK